MNLTKLFLLVSILAVSACSERYTELKAPPNCAGKWYDPVEKGKITSQSPLSPGKL